MRAERIVRRAVLWALALMAVQILIGMAQIILALEGAIAPLSAVRAAHLAIGVGAWAALVVQIALALYLPLSVVRRPSSVAVDNGRRTTDNRQRAVGTILKDYMSLTKPGVITLLIFTTVASMYITPAGAPPLALVLWTFAGGWLMASGAHAINCWADRDIDINMGRTSRRPIPSGRIPAWHALALGIALGAIAFVILVAFVNLPAALLALAGYLYYVFIYTRWLKRTTPSNIVIGRDRWTDAAIVVPVRDYLLLDATALLGAGADPREGLCPRQRTNAASGGRRHRDQAGDFAIHAADANADDPADTAADARHPVPADGAGLRGHIPGLCHPAVAHRHDCLSMGAVQVLAAVPVPTVCGDGGGSGSVSIKVVRGKLKANCNS